jgi:hypothetical protein
MVSSLCLSHSYLCLYIIFPRCIPLTTVQNRYTRLSTNSVLSIKCINFNTYGYNMVRTTEFVNTARKRSGITVICLPYLKRIIHDKNGCVQIKRKYRPVPILQVVKLKTELRCTARLTALHFPIEHRMSCQCQNFVEMFSALPDSLHNDGHKDYNLRNIRFWTEDTRR